MNVACFVNPDYGGGIARHTREMVNGLARRDDVSLEVLASRKSMGRNPELTHALRDLPLRYLPFTNVTLERLWKATGWPPIDAYVSNGCDIIYAPAHARLVSRQRPTVITIHDIQAFETDLPWSNTAEHRLFRRKWQTWLPSAVRDATRIMTDTEFSKRRLVELVGIEPSKIGVVGNGVSEVFFQAGCALHADRYPSAVVVGGLRTKKGAANTLAVARILSARKSPVCFDIVGNSEPAWEAESVNLPNIRFHGMLDDTQLAQQLSRASALLFLSPYEGFGIPAVEAMAAGTPAVVSDNAALPEVVGDAGVVVNATEHQSIADILERLCEDRTWRADLSAKGLRHVARHTWGACVERLHHQLEQAVQQAR